MSPRPGRPTILTEVARNHAASAYRVLFFREGHVSKPLNRFLPLMRRQGCRSPEFHAIFLLARDLTAARAGPRRRAAEQRDELAAAFAVLRLTTKSYLRRERLLHAATTLASKGARCSQPADRRATSACASPPYRASDVARPRRRADRMRRTS